MFLGLSSNINCYSAVATLKGSSCMKILLVCARICEEIGYDRIKIAEGWNRFAFRGYDCWK